MVDEHLEPRPPRRESAPKEPRERIEVDAQLVGMLEIVGPHGVRVEVDAAQIDCPGQPCGIVDDRLPGRSS